MNDFQEIWHRCARNDKNNSGRGHTELTVRTTNQLTQNHKKNYVLFCDQTN
jgi:hypothetical protein